MPAHLPEDRPGRMLAREVEMFDEMEKVVAASLDRGSDLNNYDVMFYNNASASYRDPGEGSLFVQRAPHQVRPPAATGVHYRLNKADRMHEVSLHIPPQLPDYEWNSVQLKTAHKVCQACHDVLNYYCRYIEARSVVRGPLEAPIFRKTDFESTKSGQKTIARNGCYQISSCIISISTLCLLGQLCTNAFCARCF